MRSSLYNWASTRGNLCSGGGGGGGGGWVCEQRRRRPACASAQTDQRLCYSLILKYHNFYSRLATSEISIFLLVSVAEETGSSLALSQTPEDRFSRDEAKIEA